MLPINGLPWRLLRLQRNGSDICKYLGNQSILPTCLCTCVLGEQVRDRGLNPSGIKASGAQPETPGTRDNSGQSLPIYGINGLWSWGQRTPQHEACVSKQIKITCVLVLQEAYSFAELFSLVTGNGELDNSWFLVYQTFLLGVPL